MCCMHGYKNSNTTMYNDYQVITHKIQFVDVIYYLVKSGAYL